MKTEEQWSAEPEDTATQNNKACLFFDAGRYDEALQIYQHISQTAESPLFITGAYHDMGRTLYQLHLYREACAAYEQAILLHLRLSDSPDQGSVPTLDEALASYQEALVTRAHMFLCQRDFDVPPIYYSEYGLALFALQRYEEALTAYLRAWQREPFYVDFADIARVLRALHRDDEAQIFDQLEAESQIGLAEYMAEQGLSEL
jgi:tetratricopeptide (TPR) repeat protein